MIELAREREEQAESLFERPHLSHSRISRYLHCPEQYRLYYIEGLRPRYPSASLVFGQIVHLALAHLFRSQTDPVKTFSETWDEVRAIELKYGVRESWEGLKATGERLLGKFIREELPRLENIDGVEETFELAISSLDQPLVGIVDLVARLDGQPTVVDFKTAGSSPEAHEAALSDQLTAYQLAQPQAEQLALCVLVKTKEPKIEWHITRRSSAQVLEYLAKAELAGREIAAGHFYKRPGKWCAWCDYLSVCLGEQKRVAGTLIRLR